MRDYLLGILITGTVLVLGVRGFCWVCVAVFKLVGV